jgi:hypothetical protein
MTRPTGGAPGDFCADPAEAQTHAASAASQRQSFNRAVLLVLTKRALRADRFHALQYDANHYVGSGNFALQALSTCRKKGAGEPFILPVDFSFARAQIEP